MCIGSGLSHGGRGSAGAADGDGTCRLGAACRIFALCVFSASGRSVCGFGTETPAPLWHGRIGSTSQAESYGSGSLPWICRTGNCPGFPYLACFFRPRNGVYCSQSSAHGSVPTFSVFPLGSSYSDRIGFIDWHWKW